VFELGEDLLDGIEVGTVGRQEEELGPGGSDSLADGLALVAAEIVHHHEIAWLEDGNEDLLDIGEEGFAVDRSVNDARSLEAVMAECRQEGERAPAAMRRLGDQLVAARSPAAQWRHVGLGPGLVDEDEATRIDPSLILPPLLTPSHDRGSILLACEQRFF